MKYKNRDSLLMMGIGWLIFWLGFLAVVGVGWVLNIIALAHMGVVMTGMGILRIAGVFIPPLGAVLGYFF